MRFYAIKVEILHEGLCFFEFLTKNDNILLFSTKERAKQFFSILEMSLEYFEEDNEFCYDGLCDYIPLDCLHSIFVTEINFEIR